MRARALLEQLEGVSKTLNGGKRYHYDKPLNERLANSVFRFWGRMILIGLAVPTFTMIAVVVGASIEDSPQEEAVAEQKPASKPNPWSIDK
jgi:hypothetical protein